MPRMVQCVKLGQELPGLEKPPFEGELGQRIYEHVSQAAWDLWPGQSVLIINHYGLNMADPESRKILKEEMEHFFFGEQVQQPEGWTPEASPAPSGKGAQGKGAGPRRK